MARSDLLKNITIDGEYVCSTARSDEGADFVMQRNPERNRRS